MIIETSLVIFVFVAGYVVGRISTQRKFDRVKLRKGIDGNG